jgi:hypothetical protein
MGKKRLRYYIYEYTRKIYLPGIFKELYKVMNYTLPEEGINTLPNS